MIFKIFEEPKHLTHNEKFLLEKINEYPHKFLTLNIVDFSKEFFTTKSTLSRLVKKLNFDSVLDMKLYCQRELTKNGLYQLKPDENTASRIENLKTFNSYAIANTIDNIDFVAFNRVCRKISSAGKILLFGIGESYLACYDLANNLQKIGINAISCQEIHDVILKIPSFTKKDLIIIFSGIEDSKEVSFLLKHAALLKIRVILITADEEIKECFSEKIILKNICDCHHMVSSCFKASQIIIVDAILHEIYIANEKNSVISEKSVDLLNR